MIDPPFEYDLSEKELQKLGEMSLIWSHTGQMIGNALMTLLRLSGDEGRVMVFSLRMDQRLRRLYEIASLGSELSDGASVAIEELKAIMPAIQFVRNNTVHAVLVNDTSRELLFHLRSKDRVLTKKQIFAVEELTNYACHVALAAWWNLGTSSWQKPLPERPSIPEFLRHLVPNRKK
jgi:hypothetical protein